MLTEAVQRTCQVVSDNPRLRWMNATCERPAIGHVTQAGKSFRVCQDCLVDFEYANARIDEMKRNSDRLGRVNDVPKWEVSRWQTR